MNLVWISILHLELLNISVYSFKTLFGIIQIFLKVQNFPNFVLDYVNLTETWMNAFEIPTVLQVDFQQEFIQHLTKEVCRRFRNSCKYPPKLVEISVENVRNFGKYHKKNVNNFSEQFNSIDRNKLLHSHWKMLLWWRFQDFSESQTHLVVVWKKFSIFNF